MVHGKHNGATKGVSEDLLIAPDAYAQISTWLMIDLLMELEREAKAKVERTSLMTVNCLVYLKVGAPRMWHCLNK